MKVTINDVLLSEEQLFSIKMDEVNTLSVSIFNEGEWIDVTNDRFTYFHTSTPWKVEILKSGRFKARISEDYSQKSRMNKFGTIDVWYGVIPETGEQLDIFAIRNIFLKIEN
jgi:hypothetical protein